MQFRSTNLFDRNEIRNLLALEWCKVLESSLVVADGPALSISALALDSRERGLSTHRQLIRMHLDGNELAGDLRCSFAPLPFENGCMQLIIARHVFDAVGSGSGLHDELMRILAPGGLMLLFGFNPLSSWRLWWLRQSLQGMPMPDWNTAAQMRRSLICADRMSSQRDYLGGAWPASDGAPTQTPGRPWHGVWTISARKERATVRPIHLRTRRKRVVLSPGLAQFSSRRIRL